MARYLGFDVSFVSGNLWSNLFGTPNAMMVAMFIGYAIAFFGGYLVIQGWRIVYHAAREDRLATDGVYGVVRHPQYTGIMAALFGEGIVHWPTILSVGLFPVIVIAYVLLARKEELRMIEKFGRRSPSSSRASRRV